MYSFLEYTLYADFFPDAAARFNNGMLDPIQKQKFPNSVPLYLDSFNLDSFSIIVYYISILVRRSFISEV